MAKKRPDEKIAAPKPGKIKENPHSAALKDMLSAEALTFKGAKKNRTVGEDKGTILLVAARYWNKHPKLPKNAVITWTHSAFWDIWEERSEK